jgi:hypothetical protein
MPTRGVVWTWREPCLRRHHRACSQILPFDTGCPFSSEFLIIQDNAEFIKPPKTLVRMRSEPERIRIEHKQTKMGVGFSRVLKRPRTGHHSVSAEGIGIRSFSHVPMASIPSRPSVQLHGISQTDTYGNRPRERACSSHDYMGLLNLSETLFFENLGAMAGG